MLLYAKNLAPPFLSIFFWIKIDDFKNQCSLVFMAAQKTIVKEKIKCVGNHACIFGRKCKIETFGDNILPGNVFMQTTVYMFSV